VRFLLLAALVSLPSCGGGGSGSERLDGLPLLVSAGLVQVEPAARDDVSALVDLARLGVSPADVEAVWELTTPAGTAFSFDVFAREAASAGDVRVSVAHAADGGSAPAGGPESLAGAGVVPSASGTASRGTWLDARGDGFARVTIRGAIERDQVLAVQSDTSDGRCTALVRVSVGAPSAINPDPAAAAAYGGVRDRKTVYSSDSWLFGLPTAAVSGDRTSIVVYEGDRAEPHGPSRFELRMQVDNATGDVTGGATQEAGRDTGHWRDHEIAALFNVLAVASIEPDALFVRLSFDRGATFARELRVPTPGAAGRLCQVAMAADYSLAVAFWRAGRDGAADLMLLEGRPSAFDGTGSPSAFSFDAPVVLHRTGPNATPVILGAEWSKGGDLVVGYGYTTFESLPDRRWRTTTRFGCAVRLFGAAFEDGLVEENEVVGRDPDVALVGQGPSLRIFYAYEAGDGIRVRDSRDAGRTWSAPRVVGKPGAHLPAVFARDLDGGTRVDVLYLAYTRGNELWLTHWDDYDTTSPDDHRLTEAKFEGGGGGSGPGPGPGPGPVPLVAAPDVGFRVTEVAWFGYDAVLVDDEIVVVYDEQTYDGGAFFGAPELDVFGRGPNAPAGAEDGAFEAAEPPPLAPGLTEPLPAPDPEHMHQLVVVRLR